jgi:hypothetical protein
MGRQYQTTDVQASMPGLTHARAGLGRAAVRHGHERGSVTLGGCRVPVQRPRVRAADGSGELPVAAYELFSTRHNASSRSALSAVCQRFVRNAARVR